MQFVETQARSLAVVGESSNGKHTFQGYRTPQTYGGISKLLKNRVTAAMVLPQI